METPLQFRLFDPQLCGGIQDDWLAYAVESNGVMRAELDAMIADGLLKRWKDNVGVEGFLLYAEQQARMAKKLQATGRYSLAELQHIFGEWNSYLEMLACDDFAYDNVEIDDYENFRRRTRDMADFFAFDLERMEKNNYPMPPDHGCAGGSFRSHQFPRCHKQNRRRRAF